MPADRWQDDVCIPMMVTVTASAEVRARCRELWLHFPITFMLLIDGNGLVAGTAH